MRIAGQRELDAAIAIGERYLNDIEGFYGPALAVARDADERNVNLLCGAFQALISAYAHGRKGVSRPLLEALGRVIGHVVAQAPIDQRQSAMNIVSNAFGHQMAETGAALDAKGRVN